MYDWHVNIMYGRRPEKSLLLIVGGFWGVDLVEKGVSMSENVFCMVLAYCCAGILVCC